MLKHFYIICFFAFEEVLSETEANKKALKIISKALSKTKNIKQS